MNRVIFCICIFIQLACPLFSQANKVQYSGQVNDNAVRIRDKPSLEGAILGRLDQRMSVTVLGRSQYRMFLDGYDSYWLKIILKNVEGWVYGAYINLTDSQYESLPILFSNNPTGAINLNSLLNGTEQEIIKKEKETLELQSERFMTISIQKYYDAIVKAFNQQQSLRPFFLNTQMLGFTETDSYIYRSSSSLSDFIQSSYIDNISISPLIILTENSASFAINGFKKMATFTGVKIRAIAINIKKIEDVNFNPLNGKTVIDFISISPYSAEDFIERSWGDVTRFNTFMTTGTFHRQRTTFLQMILE